MAAQLGLPDALRARGLTVEVVPGWEIRSAGSFNPRGAVCHWTAGPAGSTGRPSLNVVVNGRPGLPGPLCNVYGARDGVAVVVSANRANHAGVGGWRGLTSNADVFGTEMEAAGPNDFTAAQRWAYPRINAAFCDLGGFDESMVCGHSEWATPAGRKSDINGYTMDDMRATVRALLNGEDDVMNAAQEAKLDRVLAALSEGGGSTGRNNFAWLADQLVPALKDCRAALIGGNAQGMNNFHWLGAQIAALTAAVQANASEGGLSSDQITAAAKAGADQALAELGRRLPPA